MTDLGTDWRILDGTATAWFPSAGMAAGAALTGRVLELVPEPYVDLRATGVRVRVGSAEQAGAVSGAARDLGLTADPSGLQSLGVVVESTHPSAVAPFWQRVLAYTGDQGGLPDETRLTDPLRRDPTVSVRTTSSSPPLRNRLHLDVVRPADQVEQLGLGDGSGPWGVRQADADGNEVDLVPGGPFGEGSGTEDWREVFGAIACYRTTSPAQQRSLSGAAASLADAAGFPLIIDLRPGLVVLDSGKDQWDAEAHGLDLDFTDLAAGLQSAAREVGAVADPALPRFAQVFLDAADVEAVRTFWVAALGYVRDRRDGVSDLHDPHRLGPVLVLQTLDASDTERRRQRNRLHLELAVASDVAGARVEAALAAGGRLLDESGGRWRVADPEGNELVVIACPQP